MPLADAADRYPELVQEHLGSIVPADDIFVARNEASWAGGAFVYVPAGQRFEMPIGLSAIQGAAGSTMGWRSLIVLEEGAEAEVWEQYLAGDPEADSLFNGVTEIRVGAGANLRFVCGQDLSDSSWVFATQRAEVERDASLDWLALGFGSARGKVRMETKLAGRGSSAKVTGASAGLGTQHLDYDTTQEHAAPNTVSDLAFRGVLSGSATSVWRGMIRVDRDAQHTDAFQESRNLLLSLAPTRTRSPASRSKPTTSAAPTPPPSPRSMQSSSSTSSRGASTRPIRNAWSSTASSRSSSTARSKARSVTHWPRRSKSAFQSCWRRASGRRSAERWQSRAYRGSDTFRKGAADPRDPPLELGPPPLGLGWIRVDPGAVGYPPAVLHEAGEHAELVLVLPRTTRLGPRDGLLRSRRGSASIRRAECARYQANSTPACRPSRGPSRSGRAGRLRSRGCRRAGRRGSESCRRMPRRAHPRAALDRRKRRGPSPRHRHRRARRTPPSRARTASAAGPAAALGVAIAARTCQAGRSSDAAPGGTRAAEGACSSAAAARMRRLSSRDSRASPAEAASQRRASRPRRHRRRARPRRSRGRSTSGIRAKAPAS